MTENRFEELQRDLEQTLVKLKAETEPEKRRVLLREMSRLLAESDRILQTPKKGPTGQ
jgi:hypothetical protein